MKLLPFLLLSLALTTNAFPSWPGKKFWSNFTVTGKYTHLLQV